MRAIAVLFLVLGSTCAFAQDPAPVPTPSWVNPGVSIVPWSFQAVPLLASQQPVRVVGLAGQPPPVCAVKLREMSIPRDIHFTMNKVKPPKIDEKILAKVPAPACP